MKFWDFKLKFAKKNEHGVVIRSGGRGGDLSKISKRGETFIRHRRVDIVFNFYAEFVAVVWARETNIQKYSLGNHFAAI